MPLSKEELVRYSRQLVVPEVGTAGQEKLKAAKVAVVGAGGLGSITLGYLAGAGVGELGIFDSGPVELSNLHRQFIYGASDVGRLKTELAARRVREINPEVKAVAREGILNAGNMRSALAGYDYIADCTDNFATRAAINRACLALGKAYVHAAVYQMEGQVAVFTPGRGPCLGCLAPGAESAEAQACAEAGVLGPAAGAVASMQALEVIKLVLGLETLAGRFAILDLRNYSMTVIELSRDAGCPVCGDKASADRKFVEAVTPDYVSAEDLKAQLASPAPPLLLDLRYEWEHTLAHIPGDRWADHGALLKGEDCPGKDEDIVLYCKGQSKSTAAWRALKARGFTKVRVLRGGLDAWYPLDPSLPRY